MFKGCFILVTFRVPGTAGHWFVYIWTR